MKRAVLTLLMIFFGGILLASCNENVEAPEITPPGIHENQPEKPDELDTSLSGLKEKISSNGARLGIAYLGCFNGAFDDIKDYLEALGIHDTYRFTKSMGADDIIRNENNELYLVVPSDETDINVYNALPNQNTYELEKGELLGEVKSGKPFFLLCNVSEIIPNVVLEADNFDYTPSLSGENGKIVPSEYVYDFSPYENIKEYFDIQSGEADGADPIYCGSWFCEAENGDYELMALNLELLTDETARYSYGQGNSEPAECFSGKWSYDTERDMILLDMYGGIPDTDEDSESLFIDPYNLKCGFKWDMEYLGDGTYVLVLQHEEGDPILRGKNGVEFKFVQVSYNEDEDYTYLIGSWGVITEAEETYLEIFDNGDAHYYVIKDNVNEKDFYGTWTAENLTLSLSLYQCSEDGSYVEEPAVFYGEYGISYDGEFLTLSLIAESTDPLTQFMSDNYYDKFTLCGVG